MTSKERVLEIYPTAYVTSSIGFGVTWDNHSVIAYTSDGRRIEFWGRPAQSNALAWDVAWEQIQQQFLDRLAQ